MKKKLIILILTLFPFLGFSQSSNAYWVIQVDSTTNYDTLHTIKIILKANHGIPSFNIIGQHANLCTYQAQAYSLLQQPTVDTISPDTFTYAMPTIGNGTYLYIAVANTPLVGQIQIFTFQNNKPITTFGYNFLSVDSAVNNNNTARLRVTLPTVSNVGRIVLRQYDNASSGNFTTITQTPTYTTNPPTTVDFNITKTPGTYYYRAFLRRRAFLFPILDTCEFLVSDAVAVTFNQPPVIPSCAPSNLTILNEQTTKFRYKFTLNSNCPNQRGAYQAAFYRLLDTGNYDAQNPSLPQSILPNLKTARVQYKNVTNIETLTSSRITLTQQEINQGYFERDAVSKIINYGWYRIDIICATCPHPNKLISKYVFIFI